MQTKEERALLVQRLDGYLDALSLMNGNLRECRYFSYLAENNCFSPEEKPSSFYEPHEAKVEFSSVEIMDNWLGSLEKELNKCLLGKLLGSSLEARIELEKDRILQGAWYAMDMVGLITDDFTCSPIIYKCKISVVTVESASSGVLYIIPVESEYLVINLQWQNTA